MYLHACTPRRRTWCRDLDISQHIPRVPTCAEACRGWVVDPVGEYIMYIVYVSQLREQHQSGFVFPSEVATPSRRTLTQNLDFLVLVLVPTFFRTPGECMEKGMGKC
jgi:hypothetical protein